jgi:glyoxylase-like metal-dependent hydrolase (beta-lactamase superfamily II)
MINVHMHLSRLGPVLWALLLALGGCSSTLSNEPQLTQNRGIDTFGRLASLPAARDIVVLTAASQYLAAHREHDGQAFFAKLAQAHRERPLFRSLEGLMQVRVASDITLLQRVAWVESAIQKLDDGAAREPLLGRYLRGLVFAELPARFQKSAVAVADLEATRQDLERLPFAAERGVVSALAKVYAATGDPRAVDLARRAGSVPDLLADAAVSQAAGFRFEQPRLVKEAEGVYLAEGYDFSTIAFLVDPEGVIVIDAGTTEANAARALKALRGVSQAPIKHVIFTHAHWDHIGGARSVTELGAQVWASERFPQELVRIRDAHNPFRSSFWGADPIPLQVTVDHTIAKATELRLGALELTLVPGASGETADAVYVYDKGHALLFVGDAFMPYIGAPFVGEGSSAGYLEATRLVQQFPVRKLIHGHPPLTRYWTKEAMPGLESALSAVRDHTLHAIADARPLADVLHDDFVPATLVDAPAAAMPFAVTRDLFVQRIYRERAGYWSADGTGMDEFTNEEWASALDLIGGEREAAFAQAASNLLSRGDAGMALRLSDLGLRKYPSSHTLRAHRSQALQRLQARYQQVNPFRFIIYSGWSGHDVPALRE